MNLRRMFLSIGVVALATGAAIAGVQPPLRVLSHTPALNALSVPTNSAIELVFDMPVNPATFTASPFRFHAFGERSGVITGSLSFLSGNTIARFTPSSPLTPGERVWVNLSRDIATPGGVGLRQAGYSWQFWVASRRATLAFTSGGILDTTQPGISPRPYGGQACDLNDDGVVDICIVNEDTSDLRVFLNSLATPGQFAPFIQPTFGTGPVPSPNEAADFNGDGIVDMCTANTSGTTVSVLLGVGNGTFLPANDYTCGSGPHGIAVLDVDGDGDIDIATANTNDSNVAVLRNNGSGVFGPPALFEGGGNGEWALNAADMNNDGITDLVVGARSSGTISVHLANGLGGFAPSTTLNTGLNYWMIVCGDVNGDGRLDVTSAASLSGGVVHNGNGLGGLAPAQIFPTSGMIATDIGDLDGDGDLDWMLSSFQLGTWYMLVNNAGSFSLLQTFPAGSNPACALILDFNKDGALDLALIDEISDEVFLRRNTPAPPACPGDADGDNLVGFADITRVLTTWGANYLPGTGPGDVNADGVVSFIDITFILTNWGRMCT